MHSYSKPASRPSSPSRPEDFRPCGDLYLSLFLFLC